MKIKGLAVATQRAHKFLQYLPISCEAWLLFCYILMFLMVQLTTKRCIYFHKGVVSKVVASLCMRVCNQFVVFIKVVRKIGIVEIAQTVAFLSVRSSIVFYLPWCQSWFLNGRTNTKIRNAGKCMRLLIWPEYELIVLFEFLRWIFTFVLYKIQLQIIIFKLNTFLVKLCILFRRYTVETDILQNTQADSSDHLTSLCQVRHIMVCKIHLCL